MKYWKIFNLQSKAETQRVFKLTLEADILRRNRFVSRTDLFEPHSLVESSSSLNYVTCTLSVDHSSVHYPCNDAVVGVVHLQRDALHSLTHV